MRVAINEETEANAALRRTVNALRHERNVFNRVFKNLETELQKEKGKIEKNASKIEISYETRDKAQMLMNELSEDFDSEKAKWLKEWRELGYQLSLNKELEDAKMAVRFFDCLNDHVLFRLYCYVCMTCRQDLIAPYPCTSLPMKVLN